MIPVLVQAVASAILPNDAYAAAVAARLNGQTAEAIAAFEQLAQARPRDADVWLNLGLSYSAARRYADADRAFEQALALAPGYADVRLAYARNAYFRADYPAARARLAPLLAGSPDAEVQELSRRVSAAETQRPAAWRIDATYARSSLSHGLADWSSEAMTVSRRTGDRTQVALGAEHTRRFGNADTFLEGSVSRRLRGLGESYLALGGSPHADYRARLAVRAGVAGVAVVRGAWGLRLGADAGWFRYRVGDVITAQPFVAATYRGATVTLRSVNTVDERQDYRAGYAIRAEGVLAPRLRLSAGWADAPESSEGVTIAVRALSAGLAFDLNDATSLRVDLTHETRAAYSRDEAALTVSKRF